MFLLQKFNIFLIFFFVMSNFLVFNLNLKFFFIQIIIRSTKKRMSRCSYKNQMLVNHKIFHCQHVLLNSLHLHIFYFLFFLSVKRNKLSMFPRWNKKKCVEWNKLYPVNLLADRHVQLKYRKLFNIKVFFVIITIQMLSLPAYKDKHN